MNKPSAVQFGKSCLSLTALLAAAVLAGACGSPPPKDPYCSQAPLPAGAEVKSGQGGLLVEGATGDYFYAVDASGKQVNHQTLGRTLGLGPGKYQLKVNESLHPVAVAKGMLTRCVTGALMATGTTAEYYYVLDSIGRRLNHNTLGKALAFIPGAYRVMVNSVEAPAEVKMGQTTELKMGTLVVRGTTNEYYYASDTAGKQLNHNTLEKPLAFPPGSYAVKVNGTGLKADITAGQTTELETGTLLVRGATEEYYYVQDAAGNALNHQSLNKALAFFPGTYRVQVNKSEATAQVAAAQTVELQTGSLMVEGAGSDYYYVLDKTGGALNHNTLNKALSFFPAGYTVKLGQNTRPADVVAGQTTKIRF